MNNTYQTAPLLKVGDTIKIIAPSGRVERDTILRAIKIIESWGLIVQEGKHLFKSSGIFAGNDEERLSDLQESLDNREIKAIICARGGYGLSRIIDNINFDGLMKYPKWIVGFSDVTLLHSYINRHANLASIHSEMPLNYSSEGISSETLESLRELLFGGTCAYQWDCNNPRQGEAKGILAGGNLSLLCSMLGSGLQAFVDRKILFIEETGEYLYRLDRMMMSLKHAGIFEKISGLVVGGMSDMSDSTIPFGFSIEEIVLNAVSGTDFPLAFQFPAGHIKDNRAIYLGKEYFFRVDSLSAVLACTPA